MMTTWLALKQNQKNAWIGHLIDEGIESGVTSLDKKAGYQVLHFHWIKKLCLIFFTFSVTSVQLWQHDSQLLIQNFFNFRFSGEFRHNVGKTFFLFRQSGKTLSASFLFFCFNSIDQNNFLLNCFLTEKTTKMILFRGFQSRMTKNS